MEPVKIVVMIRSAESVLNALRSWQGNGCISAVDHPWWERGWIVCEASCEFWEEYCLYAPKEWGIDKKVFCYSPIWAGC